MSRATRTIIVFGAFLLILAASGILRADRGLEVSSEEAIAIAQEVVDFEPETVQVRLIRQGVGLRPVWGVSLSVPDPVSGTSFSHLTTVEVDAIHGEVLRIVRGP